VKWRLIGFNPAADVEVPKWSSARLRLSPEQTNALLQAIQGNRLTALFMVMFVLGLRRGEALGLHWQDVNLDSRKARIRTILQRFNQAFVLGEPKTSTSRRKLSIPVWL